MTANHRTYREPTRMIFPLDLLVMTRIGDVMRSKYITLVFECDTDEKLRDVREAAEKENCRAWSMDHEMIRVDLLRQAINDGDMEKAVEYLDVDGADSLIGELR
jgi:hypothetical protein